MDISLLVFAVELPSSPYSVGDIVHVEIMHNEECSHSRFVLINIIDIPDKAPAKALLTRLKLMLEAPIKTDSFDDDLRRRAWRINFKGMPKLALQKLIADRKITIGWQQAKEYLGRRLITEPNQPLTDGSIYIKDEDV